MKPEGLGLESMWFRGWMSFFAALLLTLVWLLPGSLQAQTNCEDGNGLLDFSPPKTLSVPDVIKKFGAAEEIGRAHV